MYSTQNAAAFGNLRTAIATYSMKHLFISLSLTHTYGAKTYVGKDKIPTWVYQQAETQIF